MSLCFTTLHYAILCFPYLKHFVMIYFLHFIPVVFISIPKFVYCIMEEVFPETSAAVASSERIGSGEQ